MPLVGILCLDSNNIYPINLWSDVSHLLQMELQGMQSLFVVKYSFIEEMFDSRYWVIKYHLWTHCPHYKSYLFSFFSRVTVGFALLTCRFGL